MSDLIGAVLGIGLVVALWVLLEREMKKQRDAYERWQDDIAFSLREIAASLQKIADRCDLEP